MTYTAFDTAATFDLVTAIRAPHGLNIDAARAALTANANPNALMMDLNRPELDGFPFPALAYSAATAISPVFSAMDRLAFLRDLVDRGADRPQAAAMLLAVYSDLWQSHPVTARRMTIGLHTLHTAFEPYLAGQRPLPGQVQLPAVKPASRSFEKPGISEIPF